MSLIVKLTIFVTLSIYFVEVQSKISAFDEARKRHKCPYNPKDRSLSNYRLDAKSLTCYEVPSYGPCGANMVFDATPGDSVYGTCKCNPDSNRALVYHSGTNQCYHIYEQGYCPEGQWLTLNTGRGQPMCEPNRCLSFKKRSENEFEYVMIRNTCVQLFERGNCKSGEVVDFVKGQYTPQCVNYSRV